MWSFDRAGERVQAIADVPVLAVVGWPCGTSVVIGLLAPIGLLATAVAAVLPVLILRTGFQGLVDVCALVIGVPIAAVVAVTWLLPCVHTAWRIVFRERIDVDGGDLQLRVERRGFRRTDARVAASELHAIVLCPSQGSSYTIWLEHGESAALYVWDAEDLTSARVWATQIAAALATARAA